jgi:hypothetical protein
MIVMGILTFILVFGYEEILCLPGEFGISCRKVCNWKKEVINY